MMNLLKMQDSLKNLSQDQLISEMQSPSGDLPQFLVLSEITRRQKMENAFAQDSNEEQSTVAEDAVASAGVPNQFAGEMAGAMAPQTDMAANDAVAQGGEAPPMGQPSTPPQKMAEGGIVALQDGGKIMGGALRGGDRTFVRDGIQYIIDDDGNEIPVSEVGSDRPVSVNPSYREDREDRFPAISDLPTQPEIPTAPPQFRQDLKNVVRGIIAPPLQAAQDRYGDMMIPATPPRPDTSAGIGLLRERTGLSAPQTPAPAVDVSEAPRSVPGQGTGYMRDLQMMDPPTQSQDAPDEGSSDEAWWNQILSRMSPRIGAVDDRPGQQGGTPLQIPEDPGQLLPPEAQLTPEEEAAAQQQAAAQQSAQSSGGGGRSGGGGGIASIAGGQGGMTDFEKELTDMMQAREKRAVQDKWLALAQFGMNLMASENPTLAGSIGEAGAPAIQSFQESQEAAEGDRLGLLSQLEQSRMRREQLAMQQAAAAARAAGSGGGQPAGPTGGIDVGLNRSLNFLQQQLENVNNELSLSPNMTPARRSNLENQRQELQSRMNALFTYGSGVPLTGQAPQGVPDADLTQ